MGGLPDVLANLRLFDHLQGVISCLSGFCNIVPESIFHHFQLRLWCISVEEIGIAACWADRKTV